MAANAGEKAQKTGDFYCAKCSEKVHVKQGDKIPKCPNGHRVRDPDQGTGQQVIADTGASSGVAVAPAGSVAQQPYWRSRRPAPGGYPAAPSTSPRRPTI